MYEKKKITVAKEEQKYINNLIKKKVKVKHFMRDISIPNKIMPKIRNAQNWSDGSPSKSSSTKKSLKLDSARVKM